MKWKPTSRQMSPSTTAMSRPAAEPGFTLVEVMVALLLLLIGMTGVALAQLQALRSASSSALRSQALYLAEEQLEVFHAMSFSDPALGAAGVVQDPANPIDVNPTGDPADQQLTQYFRCWQVQPNTPSTGLTTVTVEVRVGDPGCDPTQAGVPRAAYARITGIKG